MMVTQNDRCGVATECGLDHAARIDGNLREGSEKHFFIRNQSVIHFQPQRGKDFVFLLRKLKYQEFLTDEGELRLIEVRARRADTKRKASAMIASSSDSKATTLAWRSNDVIICFCLARLERDPLARTYLTPH